MQNNQQRGQSDDAPKDSQSAAQGQEGMGRDRNENSRNASGASASNTQQGGRQDESGMKDDNRSGKTDRSSAGM